MTLKAMLVTDYRSGNCQSYGEPERCWKLHFRYGNHKVEGFAGGSPIGVYAHRDSDIRQGRRFQ